MRFVSGFLALLLISATVLLAAADSHDLLVAIRNGDYSQVQRLLRAGGDANIVDSDGTTALMHAVIEADVNVVKLLLDGGANVNARNALDSTALMYAATNVAKTRLLLDRGADVKVKGKGGATPMSVAVTTFGSTPVLKLLTAKGAEPEDRLMVSAAQKGDLEATDFCLGIGVSARVATATIATLFTGGRSDAAKPARGCSWRRARRPTVSAAMEAAC